MSPEGTIINDLTIGEYDVVVSTAPARDNFDEMQFAEAISLRQVGVPIPNDMIVEYSHLSRKADIADRIRKLEGTAPPTEQQLQIQQFQAEAAIRSTQLEIAKMEAEVQRLQSEAALNVAKTASAEMDPQLKVSELQSKLQQKREELNLRERLSEMTNSMRKNQTDTAAAAKMATEAMKNLGTTGGTE
jgi:vacuolar-type H+-ATPase subunit I/STV1